MREVAEVEDSEQAPDVRPRAFYELSEVYSNGLCEVERSREKALELLKKAAELGDDLALIQLGEYYRDGKQKKYQSVQEISSFI